MGKIKVDGRGIRTYTYKVHVWHILHICHGFILDSWLNLHKTVLLFFHRFTALLIDILITFTC
jgi:hypothetical protein